MKKLGSLFMFNVWMKAVFLLCLFVLCCYGWNQFYFYYKSLSDYRGDIFRDGIKESFFPFYMWYMPFKFSHIPFVGTSLLYLLVIYKAFQRPIFKTVILVAFAWLLWCISAAYTDGLTRVIDLNGHIQTFANDLVHFNSVNEILSKYVQIQPFLDTHGQHYPPGILILIKFFGVYQFRTLLYIASFLSIILIYQVALKLTSKSDIAFLSSILLASTSGLLIFTTIDVAPIVILLSLVLTYSLLKLLDKPSVYYMLLTSLSMCFLVMCSFVVSLWVLIFAFYILVERRSAFNLRNAQQLLSTTMVVLAFFVVLAAVFHFNIYECFRQSVHGHMEQNQSNGYDDFGRYILRSFCNALQFILTCGLMLAFVKVNKNNWFSRSFVLTVLLTSFSGLFFCETERSWLILLPFACLVSAQSISNTEKLNPAWVSIICIISSTLLEIFFKNYI